MINKLTPSRRETMNNTATFPAPQMGKILEELIKERNNVRGLTSNYIKMRTMVFDCVIRIIQAHNPWIPVSEGLPPAIRDVNETSRARYYDYLVRDKYKNHWIAFHHEGRWYDRSCECFIDDITDYQYIYLEPTEASNDKA